MFKVGDKLKASDFDRIEYGLKFVIISSINYKNKVYHWRSNLSNCYISSGYFFDEAIEFKD